MSIKRHQKNRLNTQQCKKSIIFIHNELTCSWSVREQAQKNAADESDGDQSHSGARFSQAEVFAMAVQGFKYVCAIRSVTRLS